MQFFIPPAPTNTGFTLAGRLSVHLWTESCQLCIFHNTSRIYFIVTHLINQLQKVCCVLRVLTNFKIGIFANFFKIVTLDFVLFKDKFVMQVSAGCPAVREKSGKFQTWQKSGKSQGILLKVREKMSIGKSQGICI